MEFRIDTGMVGEVKAANLRAALEASRDHWLETQAKHAASQVVHRLASGDPKSTDLVAVGKAAALAEQTHRDGAKALAGLMALGIDSACAWAEELGGTVTASVTGHLDARHASGCEKRLVVAVDRTWD